MNTNFSGVWKALLDRSRLAGATPVSLQATVEQSETELRLELVATFATGGPRRAVLVCHQGQDTYSFNGAPIRGSMAWDGPELLIETCLPAGAGALNLRDYWSLSSDGKLLSMEHRDDDLAGQLLVFERFE